MSLSTNVSDLATAIATTIKEIRTWVNGNNGTGVSGLDTTATTLVGAINEVKATADSAAGGGAVINDGIIADDSTWSSEKIDLELDGKAALSHVHAAGDVTSGTLDIARIPTGTSGTTVALGNHAHSGVYQPVDSDLTAIAALTPTEGQVLRRGASAWEAFTLINDSSAGSTTVYSSTKTDAQIAAAVANLLDSAPGALDTLNELAAALGDDPAFATTVTNNLALKAPLASPTFTGTPAAPTAAGGTNTTQIATTAFVQAAIPAASDTVAGKVELATNAEVITGSDTVRAVTPAGLRNAYGDSAADYVATFNAGLV